MSGVVNSIAAAGKNLGGQWTDLTHGNFKGVAQNIGGFGHNMLQTLNPSTWLSNGNGPQSPGINPSLQNLQQQQLQNATQFRQNLPGLENQMQTNMKVGANNQMNQGMQNIRSYNASRGMSYGGVNQGMQQGLRAQTQGQVAQNASNIHQGLINSANQMDQAAISTGMGIQNQSQQMQNSIYANAMANMNSQNQMMGSLIGAGLLVAIA
jgi:hypothetical protein